MSTVTSPMGSILWPLSDDSHRSVYCWELLVPYNFLITDLDAPVSPEN